MPDKYYLTTPLYYVNSKPHIGHSYTQIAADTLARFKRSQGKDVFFLTGTDEHGQKIEKAASDAGLEPKEFTDKMVGTFESLWKILDISYDDFIRTTQTRHIQAVQKVWRDLGAKKEIYKDTYSGWYCTPCESFSTENICSDCKRPTEEIEEDNYFLKMSAYQHWLIEHIRTHEHFILPKTRRNEVLGFLENNQLQDLCISRPKSRLSWGIPSPISDAHVTYVWFDALINYITAVGFAVDEKKLKKWWPADVHIIGKDILRHHAVYWPILLKALDLELPKMIFAHGWWVQGGEKMSKSRGNVVDPVQIVQKYGVDAYRYFLLSEAPFGQDGTFSEEALIERFNTDLANDLGNLLHRTLTMCEKYFEGQVPEGVVLDAGDELYSRIIDLTPQLEKCMAELAFKEALNEIWQLISRSNKFIEESAPWTLAKQGKTEHLKRVIVTLMDVLKAVAEALGPFMPGTAEAMLKQLGSKGGKTAKGSPLFPRIEKPE